MDSLSVHDPRQIGPFTLLGRLGRGGMGTVFLGRLPSGRLAAIKLVNPGLAEDSQFRERFAREVDAARAVGGFFNAPIIDADTRAETPWLATAYVEGPTLHEAVRQHGALSTEAATTVLLGLCEALIAIHHARLVHRDLKPSNIILAPDGPRVIDFGIAHAVDNLRITDYGTVIGTPEYMSPEQTRGEVNLSWASDVFALGSVMVFASAGHAPFYGGHYFAMLENIRTANPDLDGVPHTLAPIVAACLDKEPGRRPRPAQVLGAATHHPRPPSPGHVDRDRWWVRRL
ncbi:serine/threonine-protein kinase [Mycobacterium paragordonae]|uniref:serine/threonine-protein kinase n=1 Tax=Mycobacterium paragordonae TaxID=1389713 RepID=UPI0012E26D84|nr:serine/threonine-protein kinase [Mycobacterium paragordonae]